MSRTVHLNGQFLPEAEARVSVFDRGYLFADGVYEVTAVIDGKLIDFEPHMDRLARSLGELDMAWPVTRERLREVHEELLERNGLREGRVYMQVTRGVSERDFGYPKDTESTLLAFTQAANVVADPKAEKGVKAISIPDIRWKRRDIKSIALLAQCMGKQKAAEAGAYEGWMHEDGYITEGTASTSYIVAGGRIVTRPLSNAVLPGVTRLAILRLAAECNLDLEERPFTLEEAYAADEAFLTSASAIVLPIIDIDGRAIGSGKPGAIARRLRELYLEEARGSSA
ncbi:MAG TPA: D-amino-acid transaminase [Aestuariivirgaceae bacterium]|nr:D-amino-acid transaminase [Aestuariivirgaceae bacterium]